MDEEEEKRRYLRILASILLIISAFTHVLQLFVYGFEWHQITAAIYGAFYLLLGILLIKYDKKIVLLLCIFIPAIGGSLGVLRFIAVVIIENIYNFFIIFHVLVDIIVVPICIYLYLTLKKQ